MPSWIAVGPVSRPSPEDHERAKESFRAEVEAYRERLGEWLDDYQQAALARWETFEVSVTLTNAIGAAHADTVQVVLELSETVTRGSPVTAVDAAPKRPTYQPPRSRTMFDTYASAGRPIRPTLRINRHEVNLGDIIPLNSSSEDWMESEDGSHLTAPKVDVQPGRTVEIASPLLLRVAGPGVHEVRWTIYGRNLHPISGSIPMFVPSGDPERPPIGRVDGVLRYPDVPIAIERDESDAAQEDSRAERAVRQVRDCDPPLTPPNADGDDHVLADLRAVVSRGKWEALGLDPALDGPSSSRAHVEEARLSRPNQSGSSAET